MIMSLFDKIFGKQNPAGLAAAQYLKSFNAYIPAFTNWNGALYESELVRSAVDARARHIAKLKVDMLGAAQPQLKTWIKSKPNDFQTWSQFLYRLSTILDMQNTAFIVPVLNQYGEHRGYFPVLPNRCDVLEYQGEAWLRYRFSTGQVGAVEWKKCGIMTKYQYDNDYFGSNNAALNPTMELINMQNQGIQEGIKNSASFRFMAKLTNFKSPEDLATEQKNFVEHNFKQDSSGFLLFPNTYADIQQVNSNPFTIDADQMKLIQTNVYNYFGVNEDVLQNKAIGDELDAFFEGAIEPFSIQLSEVMTNMTFTKLEQAYGAKIEVLASRLQYMKTKDKINFAKELGDRGFITINEVRELLNYEPLPDGDKQPIRGEYYFVGDESSKGGTNDGQGES